LRQKRLERVKDLGGWKSLAMVHGTGPIASKERDTHMSHRKVVGAWVIVTLLVAPMEALAQLPGGVQLPGGTSLPTGGFSKDALLTQAKEMVADLTSMKTSGKLAAPQAKQVDELLPKANSLTRELVKPQVKPSKLSQLASQLSDLQKQVGALKGLMK